MSMASGRKISPTCRAPNRAPVGGVSGTVMAGAVMGWLPRSRELCSSESSSRQCLAQGQARSLMTPRCRLPSSRASSASSRRARRRLRGRRGGRRRRSGPAGAAAVSSSMRPRPWSWNRRKWRPQQAGEFLAQHRVARRASQAGAVLVGLALRVALGQRQRRDAEQHRLQAGVHRVGRQVRADRRRPAGEGAQVEERRHAGPVVDRIVVPERRLAAQLLARPAPGGRGCTRASTPPRRSRRPRSPDRAAAPRSSR